MNFLTRKGFLIEEQGMTYLADSDPDPALGPPGSDGSTYRIALGPRAGQKALANRPYTPIPPPRTTVTPPSGPASMSWVRLLKRVFENDNEQCPQCGGTLKIIASIEQLPVIAKTSPISALPARASPRSPARLFDRLQIA